MFRHEHNSCPKVGVGNRIGPSQMASVDSDSPRGGKTVDDEDIQKSEVGGGGAEDLGVGDEGVSSKLACVIDLSGL